MRPKAIPAYPAAGRSQANLAYSALLLTFLGWAILERWSFSAQAGLTPHLIAGVACAPILACTLRRFHAACPRYLRAAARPPGIDRRAALLLAVLLALLFAVGALFAMATCGGSAILVAALAALCCLMPWTALRAHQLHLFPSFVAVTAGAALAPALARMPPGLMASLASAWCLWAIAAALCVGLYGQEARRHRRS